MPEWPRSRTSTLRAAAGPVQDGPIIRSHAIKRGRL